MQLEAESGYIISEAKLRRLCKPLEALYPAKTMWVACLSILDNEGSLYWQIMVTLAKSSIEAALVTARRSLTAVGVLL